MPIIIRKYKVKYITLATTVEESDEYLVELEPQQSPDEGGTGDYIVNIEPNSLPVIRVLSGMTFYTAQQTIDNAIEVIDEDGDLIDINYIKTTKYEGNDIDDQSWFSYEKDVVEFENDRSITPITLSVVIEEANSGMYNAEISVTDGKGFDVIGEFEFNINIS